MVTYYIHKFDEPDGLAHHEIDMFELEVEDDDKARAIVRESYGQRDDLYLFKLTGVKDHRGLLLKIGISL